MSDGTTQDRTAKSRERELTPEQAASLHDILVKLRTEIDAVLPRDACIGKDVQTEPFELLAHLRFYGEETVLYLENLLVKQA